MQNRNSRMFFTVLGISSMLIISGIISGIPSAICATSTKPPVQASKNTFPKKPVISASVLDGIVKSGTITQAQKASVLKALQGSKKTLNDILSSLVKSKTISKKQETAIQKALLQANRPNDMPGNNPQGNPPNAPGGNPPSINGQGPTPPQSPAKK